MCCMRVRAHFYSCYMYTILILLIVSVRVFFCYIARWQQYAQITYTYFLLKYCRQRMTTSCQKLIILFITKKFIILFLNIYDQGQRLVCFFMLASATFYRSYCVAIICCCYFRSLTCGPVLLTVSQSPLGMSGINRLLDVLITIFFR